LECAPAQGGDRGERQNRLTASAPHRKLYNAAVLTRITIRDGRVNGWDYHQPFDALLTRSEVRKRTSGWS